MNDEMGDLRERFERLRGEEQRAAPAFQELLHRPPRPRPASGRRLTRLVLAAAAVAVVAIGLSRLVRPKLGAEYAIDLSSTSWHGPTDFLLVLPEDASLRTIPRLGETNLNWRTP